MGDLFTPIVIERSDTRHVRHDYKCVAIAEAQRLARLHPGKAFAVYIPILIVESPPAPLKETKVIDGTEIDIPF